MRFTLLLENSTIACEAGFGSQLGIIDTCSRGLSCWVTHLYMTCLSVSALGCIELPYCTLFFHTLSRM